MRYYLKIPAGKIPHVSDWSGKKFSPPMSIRAEKLRGADILAFESVCNFFYRPTGGATTVVHPELFYLLITTAAFHIYGNTFHSVSRPLHANDGTTVRECFFILYFSEYKMYRKNYIYIFIYIYFFGPHYKNYQKLRVAPRKMIGPSFSMNVI